MCLADQRHCALSLRPSDALRRGLEPTDSFVDKSSTWRKWDLMEMWVLLHFIDAVLTVLTIERSSKLSDSGWAWRQMCWRALTNQRQAWPILQREWLVCPWKAAVGLRSGLTDSQMSTMLLSFLPAPQRRTGLLWCQFKWPWLLFLQYCLSQCIRHLGTEPWSSASVSRDVMDASQHTWTEICI